MIKFTPFKTKYSLSQRRSLLNRSKASIMKSDPAAVIIPVVVEPQPEGPELLKISQVFLLKKDIKVNQFLHAVRKKLKVQAHQTVFLFKQNSVLSPNTTLSTLLRDFQEEDGFLYLVYSEFESFGED